jgi:hypothetical protein
VRVGGGGNLLRCEVSVDFLFRSVFFAYMARINSADLLRLFLYILCDL